MIVQVNDQTLIGFTPADETGVTLGDTATTPFSTGAYASAAGQGGGRRLPRRTHLRGLLRRIDSLPHERASSSGQG
jgi:hypothetical protein